MKFVASILGILLAGAPALADMGPPPGWKRAKTTNRITTELDLRGTTLILVVHSLPFGPEYQGSVEFVKLPLEKSGHYRQAAELLVLPTAVADEYGSAKAIQEAAKNRGEIQRFPLAFDEDVPAWYGTDFTINHRLERDAAGRYSLVRTSWRPANQCCVVALLVPLAFAILGIRLIRSRVRRRREP